MSSFSSLTPFNLPASDTETLPKPLIKLTDFSLSRFIYIDETTGESEAHTALKLMMGGAKKGLYDARDTDAWACSVVLYALGARGLPFDEGVSAIPSDHNHQQEGNSGRGGAPGYGRGQGRGSVAERRHWSVRIARREYEWPASPSSLLISSGVNANVSFRNSDSGELIGVSVISGCGVVVVDWRLV